MRCGISLGRIGPKTSVYFILTCNRLGRFEIDYGNDNGNGNDLVVQPIVTNGAIASAEK
jgi:hypothetical protein